MKLVLVFIGVLTITICYGQNDGVKIYSCGQFKKGFYKNYKEFIDNSPSIEKKFAVIPIPKPGHDADTSGLHVIYKLDDSSAKIGHVWGFCDGQSVYVNYSHSLFKNHYWKIEYIGRYSIFMFGHKNIYAVGPGLFALATIAASAAAPAQYDVMIINEKGKIQNLTASQVKKALVSTPDLLKDFEDELVNSEIIDEYGNISIDADKEMKICKTYLIKFNERVSSK